jgi:hypothetical protein
VTSGHLLSQTFTMRDVCVAEIVFDPSSPPSVSVLSENDSQNVGDSLLSRFIREAGLKDVSQIDRL